MDINMRQGKKGASTPSWDSPSGSSDVGDEEKNQEGGTGVSQDMVS
jgi:hypothetical protein